jgi:3-hydroxybutyryl-CoA dehydrogenase
LSADSGLRVAVIGAGLAGRAFAAECAAAGLGVVLEDVMPEKLRRAEHEFAELGRAVALVATVEDAVRDADLVVDFVPDELESKLEIWSLIDRMAPPKTVMCTPSEVLSITDLASCTYRADRCVMVRGDLVSGARLRLLTARETSESTQALVGRLFGALGRGVDFEHDPDLPMLLKNMNASTLQGR